MKKINLLKNIVIIAILSSISCGVAIAKISGALSPEAVKERIKPAGNVNIVHNKESQNNTDKETKKTKPRPVRIYKAYCAMCHSIGLAGAPKPGDGPAWNKRLKQGHDVLLSHVMNGYKAMPPKGGCTKCSKEDISDTIKKMIKGEGLD